MTVLTGLMRLGRDCEVRYTPDGTAVANLALAFNYGQKKDGKRPSQWVDAAMFGKRAESLAQYLTKGVTVSAVLDDVHIRTYDKNGGGQGFALSARVVDLEFAGKPQSADQQQKPAERPAPTRATPPGAGAAQGHGPGAFEPDDIPFAPRSGLEAL